MEFLAENWGTLLVGAILVAVVAGIVVKMWKDRKAGKRSCGCGCADCAASALCHKNDKKEQQR